MIDAIEDELRAALADRAREVPAEARQRIRRADYRPRTRTVRPRMALGGVAVVAASSGAVIALVGLGSSTAPAFAGWSATPTQPASGQTGTALERCSSQLSNTGGSQGIPAAGWQPVLTDTRGPFTAMILHNGGASATCFAGPSFTTIQANSAPGNASEHTVSGSASGSGSGIGSSSLATGVMGLGGHLSGPISQAAEAHLTTSSGQPYTFLQGQVATDVSALTLVRSDGTDVQATVADGSFVAWWPGGTSATSAQLTSPSGTSTQQLSFTMPPQPPCPGGISCSSESAGSSPAEASSGEAGGKAERSAK